MLSAYNAIESSDLIKRYGKRQALNGLNLQVPTHAIFGLIGPNGAGKTTWMLAVAGLLKLHGGTINLLNGGAFDPAIHSGRISVLPQDSELPLDSTPMHLLTHYARLQGLTRREAMQNAQAMLRQVNLATRTNDKIRTLSHGMRKRVMVAQCFLGRPEVVLLDEPLSGLDPRETANMRQFIARRRGHQTIVISSHNLHEIETLCDHVAFIEQGRTVKQDTLAAIMVQEGILIYHLSAPPSDLKLLDTVADLTQAPHFKAADQTLTCYYDPQRATPDMINRRILPLLLQQTGINAIHNGSSLENVYLDSAAPTSGA